MIESPSGTTVTVSIEREIQDYREAYAWWRWHSWAWPSLIATWAVASVVVLWTFGGAALAYVLVWALLIGIVYFAGLALAASRMQKAHRGNGATSYTFSAAGFEHRSSVGHSQSSWAAVDRAVETRRSFLLVYANACFLMIPKHCIPESDLATLRRMLVENLGKKTTLA